MKNGNDGQNAPEKVGYTRYYEHDGMLRAYANRSMVLAMVFGVIALSSFAFAVYVRLQPPTVIRVDSEGEAAIVGGTPAPWTYSRADVHGVCCRCRSHRRGVKGRSSSLSGPLFELHTGDG